MELSFEMFPHFQSKIWTPFTWGIKLRKKNQKATTPRLLYFFSFSLQISMISVSSVCARLKILHAKVSAAFPLWLYVCAHFLVQVLVSFLIDSSFSWWKIPNSESCANATGNTPQNLFKSSLFSSVLHSVFLFTFSSFKNAVHSLQAICRRLTLF